MKKSTHSKIKNTGILFELLTRQITADTLTGVDNSPALKIVKEFFAPKSILAKELVLYQTLLNESFNTKSKAETLLGTTIKLRRKLNSTKLNEQKYKLIKEIKDHYDLKDFFKSTINEYKIYASVYRVFEGASISKAAQVVSSRYSIVEHITRNKSKKTLIEKSEYGKQDDEIRLLAYKLMMDKFNTKYAGLSEGQQKVLKIYINNISNTTDLRDFVIKESKALKVNLKKKSKKIDDKVTSIKLSEVINLLERNESIKRVDEDHVHSLLLYHELLKEI